MRVQRQEVAMVVVIVWIFSIVAQIQQIGFWQSLLAGLPLGLLAGVAYWLLMPWVIRWAAKGVKPKDPTPGKAGSDHPESSDEESARR